MTGRRAIVLGVVAWLFVVVAGAGLVWAVISRAGEDLASTAQPSADPGPSRTARPEPARTSPSEPARTSPSEPTGTSPSGPTPSPTLAERTPRQPSVVTETWQDDPGYVVARCEGSTISANAQPDVGWRIEVDENGPREVDVEFESADERSRVRVEAVCVDGAPVFEVDTREKG